MHNKHYYYQTVGNNIKNYRNYKDLTLEQLANIIELDGENISRIENVKENQTFSLGIVGRIADSLNIPISYLFNETNEILKTTYKMKINHSEDYFYELFRLNLRRLRKTKRITQSELSKNAGFKTNHIGQIESPCNRKHFTIYAIGKIADSLNVPMMLLFDETDLDISPNFQRQ